VCVCVRVYSCHHKGANQFAQKTVLMLAHSTYIEARPLLMLFQRVGIMEMGRYEMWGDKICVCVCHYLHVCSNAESRSFCLVVFKCQMQCGKCVS
jgi:hypothetical protein